MQVSDSPHGNLTYGMQKGKEQFMLFTVFSLAWFYFKNKHTYPNNWYTIVKDMTIEETLPPTDRSDAPETDRWPDCSNDAAPLEGPETDFGFLKWSF